MTLKELEEGKAASLAEIAAAADAEAIEKLRVKYVGRNGSIPALIKGMKDVPKEDRPAFGKAVQAWKAEVEAALAAKGTGGGGAQKVAVDATLPGRWPSPGAAHPLSRVIADSARIFAKLGFTVADGPDVENRFNNFTALNTPPHHPSQDRSDTFWLTLANEGEEAKGDLLLRTQTSPVQIRTMLEAGAPPVRVICPGRTYRRDTTDATHSANFHQIEGLYVDVKPVSLADLKSVLAYFTKEMMGEGIGVRFRPHFFPFTEPSVEVDMTCHVCKGKGCNVCKQSGWIEIAGAGMVDPRVFKHVGWDPEKVSGYAFGFGVERIAMIKYGIPDIRWLYENDLRFLEQTA
ncbi:MAG: phenylalanine--tRNA ligase subunit alpha [Kiritimatiellae bacterium]|nr:phenylalanine--tRNA ligase subunit alpha [Kiritimatiellia bacterium]